ncbi:MAG TPA: DnaJ domain-containing protein [Erythrobacter sp.]|nr:DnaJ domain-containing protein [Erythrobacter sp.]
MPSPRFHGRVESAGRQCEAPACREAGEFRAPGGRPNGFDGPGDWRWFCLQHVREFNAGYDWFEGMSAEEIIAAQSPIAGWRSETRAFRPDAGVDGVPRWADYADPLDAIAARARGIRGRAEGRAREAAMMVRFSPDEARALEVMGLGSDTDRTRLRRRYSELVRRYHPDRNGGDRQHEARLTEVVEAYQLLKGSAALA